jgi:hypothetical protein
MVDLIGLVEPVAYLCKELISFGPIHGWYSITRRKAVR